MRAAVADDQAHGGGGERAAVLALEECGRFDDRRRDFDDVGAADRAGGESRCHRHAAAEADDADVLGTPMQEHRKEPEQPLREHVAAV